MPKVINPKATDVRKLMEMAGTHFGSVRFIKKSNGKERRMSYRLKVRNPSIASRPSGKGKAKKADIITVLDTNKVIYKDGKKIGRGDWRSIDLNTVTRIKAGSKIWNIVRN